MSNICELSCNLDDMTGEEIGFAFDVLLDAGALDVYTQPIYMKKNRPATMLTVLCNERDEEKFIGLIFKHTSTLGIRKNLFQRFTLDREIKLVDTEFGKVRKKVATGYGITKEKYEYEDIAKCATENNLSYKEVLEKLGE